MRRILGLCVILALSTAPAYAWQEPAVSTPVPNIHASGATGVTNSASNVLQGTTTAPATTTMTSQGTMVATQPGAAIATPTGTPTYYYYRTGLFGRRIRMVPANSYTVTSAPVYTAPAPTYYAPVRRVWPFGLFQCRFNQNVTPYTTTTYYTTPGYYTTGYYGPIASTNTVPAPGMPSTATPASTAAPIYTTTTYDVPTGTPAPAVTVPNSGALPPVIPNRISPK